MDKIYIINEKRYKQIEIEVQQMDEDKTVVFCVEESKELESVRIIQDLFFACKFSALEVMEELAEMGFSVFYMCSIFDNRIINELQ